MVASINKQIGEASEGQTHLQLSFKGASRYKQVINKYRLETGRPSFSTLTKKRFWNCLLIEAINRKDLTFYVVLDKFINGLKNMPASYSRTLYETKISPFGSIFLCLNPTISRNLCISLRKEPVLLKSKSSVCQWF